MYISHSLMNWPHSIKFNSRKIQRQKLQEINNNYNNYYYYYYYIC